MLLGTAFLSTPVISVTVAGAFVVSSLLGAPAAHAAASVSAPASVFAPASASAPASLEAAGSVTTGAPNPYIGPDPIGGGNSIDTIARFDGVTLLDKLARLSTRELTAFVDGHPDALEQLTTAPPAASDVAGWWARTPAFARTTLATDLPGVVGNLEGVPYDVRDAANRAFLAQTEDGIRAQLEAGVGRAKEEELEESLHMLAAVRDALRLGPSREPRTLVALDVTGDGRAVVAVGDLGTADYVSYYIPGMYIGVADQLADWTADAETGLEQQKEWMADLGIPGTAATVAWIGYHTPTIVNISSFDLAYQGRDALTGSLQGLDAVRTADEPYVTVVGHSYGSTAAMLALQENDVTIDALVLVGSPGSPATSVGDLKVRGGNVWVAAADSDPIPHSGVFGSQPLDPDFGAHEFSVHAMTDPLSGQRLAENSGHNSYFSAGTTSVRNTALIALGHGELASTDAPPAKAIAR